MKKELVTLLRCPVSSQELVLEDGVEKDGEIFSGKLVCKNGSYTYPIHNFIPRFVAESNYADNFGKQWNKFRLTQLDSYSRTSISADRFWKATGLSEDFCKGKVFLDAGCGAGRFAEVVLNAGGTVIALDFSSAVDAAMLNLKHFKNFHVIQADIYKIPLKSQSFDVVYSLGVLQHTPNVEAAFRSLPKFVSRSGILCTDFYWRRIRTLMHSKYLVRPLTKRIDQIKLFSFLEKYTHFILKISIFLSNIPLAGKFLMRLVPVANYSGVYPLSKEQLIEWALLDTFDMLAPQYDTPQTEKTIRKWMEEEGLESIEVLHANLLAIRGIKK